MVGETVRRENRWPSAHAISARPETGSLHRPVAEAATSGFDVLKGALFIMRFRQLTARRYFETSWWSSHGTFFGSACAVSSAGSTIKRTSTTASGQL
jgi:hypothetical protein